MVMMFGVISITEVSNFLTIRFTVQTWGIFVLILSQSFYLSVKGVELQLVGALEGLGVDLLEGDPVELALEDVDLLHVVVRAPNVVSLPRQRQLCVFCALSRGWIGRRWNIPLSPRSSLCCQRQGRGSRAGGRLQGRERSAILCSSSSSI